MKRKAHSVHCCCHLYTWVHPCPPLPWSTTFLIAIPIEVNEWIRYAHPSELARVALLHQYMDTLKTPCCDLLWSLFAFGSNGGNITEQIRWMSNPWFGFLLIHKKIISRKKAPRGSEKIEKLRNFIDGLREREKEIIVSWEEKDFLGLLCVCLPDGRGNLFSSLHTWGKN